MKNAPLLAILLISLVVAGVAPARAEGRYSPGISGTVGLVKIPTARMDEQGTLRLGVSGEKPYFHGHLGLQIAQPLYIQLRQTGQTSDLRGDPDRLYPGLDLKLRLLDEGPYHPAISLGLQSAFGHKRMAGEYIALSKRIDNFDLTGGVAWGRLGSAAHISNPLKTLSGHFGQSRRLDGEMPNGPEDWFTGEDIGFFAGIEYFPAMLDDKVSLKAEWGADRYIAERSYGKKAPAPWAIGINLHPKEWLNVSAAIVGGDRITGSLTIQNPLAAWKGSLHKDKRPRGMRVFRTEEAQPANIELAAQRDNLTLYETALTPAGIRTYLAVDDDYLLPQQLGRAARHMANDGGQNAEDLAIIPMRYGLRGPDVHLLRRDLERALINKQGSPQEIWRHTAIEPATGEATDENDNKKIKGFWQDLLHDPLPGGLRANFRLFADQELSLSEEDTGVLYRTSLVAEARRQAGKHLLSGAALRLNVKDNLNHLHDFRPRLLLPVRGDIDRFAGRTVGLENLYTAYTDTLSNGLHVSVTGGYLEEMYAGLGGEILYRPYGKRYAIGVEAWQAFKRDPGTALNLGLSGDHILSGHVTVWYDIPQTDLTLEAKFGRYLAEDIGGTLRLSQSFRNGVKMAGFVTATDQADFDVLGGTTHIYSGLQISLPLGNVPYIPEGSALRLGVRPQGRNTGQALDKPIDLYQLTEPFSLRHISRHWSSVLE